jgi:hypothetical protein
VEVSLMVHALTFQQTASGWDVANAASMKAMFAHGIK